MRWKAVLALPILLSGCASPYTWVKNGSTPEEYERGLARCRYEAVAATAGYSSGRVAPTMSGAVAQGIGEGMAIGIRQSELFALCLQASGYTKIAKINGSEPPSYASLPAPVAVQPSATIAAKRVEPDPGKRANQVPATDETAMVVKVLEDSGYPLVGVPSRSMQKENRTYYDAWGKGGRLTRVICENGSCRMPTIYD